MNLTLILYILFTHWVADFVFQTNEMALNKSKSIEWLSYHVCVYTLPWFVIGWQFALINGICHWVIDFLSSKVNAVLYEKSRHYFFVAIGFDQFLHYVVLFGSYFFLYIR